MRNLLYILPGLLHNWMSNLLFGMEQRKTGMLHLKLVMLHQELGTRILKLQTWDLHQRTTQKRGFNKLTRL
jgi:hypothetical protein